MTGQDPGSVRALLASVAAACGPDVVVTDPSITASRGVDWTGRFRADPPAVVRPRGTDDVVAVLAGAVEHGVAVVPQGGNTGLVGGATPLGGEVVVDLGRLDQIAELDPLGGQLRAGAGATIADVQAAARSIGWAYGVDWAARDTATVGGSVATDAGGLRFLRHGSTRRQLLGVEAVLGSGDVVSHLPHVEKDNTGYDLASVLCGSEGTLGVVTAARLRLVAPTPPTAVALVGFDSVAAAVDAASALRRSGTDVQAIELMVAAGLDLVGRTFGRPAPLERPAAAVLLVEASDGRDPLRRLAELVGGVVGATTSAVAEDRAGRARLWSYREDHTLAINQLGPPHKLDVTLPAAELAAFVDEVPAIVAGVAPAARTWCFGHAADGNVHVNVTGLDPDDESVADAVFQEVAARRGSISAEHGIGRAKRRWLHLAHGPGDLAAMRALKRAFDPAGVCNPEVLL